MEPMVIPIGHFMGPVFTQPGEAEPDAYDIRIGDEVISLDLARGRVWALAHGDLEGDDEEADPSRSREDVESDATSAGVEDPGVILDTLVQRGLLALITPSDPGIREFAEQHNVFPLALGLGNSSEQPQAFFIGMPEAHRVVVGQDVYHLWMIAHRHPSLWHACDSFTAARRDADVDGLITDPDELLAGFLSVVPALIAGSCAYLDRVVSVEAETEVAEARI